MEDQLKNIVTEYKKIRRRRRDKISETYQERMMRIMTE